MEMNRRKSIMSIIGGVFAGPAMAEKAMNAAKIGNTIPPVGTRLPDRLWGGKVQETIKETDPIEALRKRNEYINQLKSTINGELSEWQQKELDSYRLSFEANIDSLKSVSTPIKQSMKHDKFKINLRTRWIEEAKESLANMLKWS